MIFDEVSLLVGSILIIYASLIFTEFVNSNRFRKLGERLKLLEDTPVQDMDNSGPVQKTFRSMALAREDAREREEYRERIAPPESTVKLGIPEKPAIGSEEKAARRG